MKMGVIWYSSSGTGKYGTPWDMSLNVPDETHLQNRE